MSERKCECGNWLTDIEIAACEQMAKDSETHIIYMCSDCWENYCNHAITGG